MKNPMAFHGIHKIVQPPSSSKTLSSPLKETRSLPQGQLVLIPPSPPPQQVPVCFLSLQICVFWAFRTNTITQRVVLCDGFLHSVSYLQGSSTLPRVPEFRSFSWLNNIPGYVHGVPVVSFSKQCSESVTVVFCDQEVLLPLCLPPGSMHTEERVSLVGSDWNSNICSTYTLNLVGQSTNA